METEEREEGEEGKERERHIEDIFVCSEVRRKESRREKTVEIVMTVF